VGAAGGGVAYTFEADGRRVRVRDATGVEVTTLTPFEASFTGTVSVTTADFDGDGLADLIVTPGAGGGGRVNVYRGADLAAGKTDPLFSFLGIDDPAYRGGAAAAFGDLNGDGVPDLIVAAGDGGPRVAVYDGRALEVGSPTPAKLTGDFFAFEPSLLDGTTVAAGDVTGDGVADLVLGAGLGGAPRVRVFDGRALLTDRPLAAADFYAGDPGARDGVRVALQAADGATELLTRAGEASTVRVYATAAVRGAADPACDRELDPTDPALPAGVFVG
jgi:hypothetical protein